MSKVVVPRFDRLTTEVTTTGVSALTTKEPTKLGRPVGEARRAAEFRRRMLGTVGHRILSKAFDIALDDEHKEQVTMIKFLIGNATGGGSHGSVDASGQAATVNFTLMVDGIKSPTKTVDATDAKWKEVEPNGS